MRLSRHSDYAFRLLIDSALRDPNVTTVAEVAAAFDVSAAHLHKVAQTLASHGYLETIRGRSGGVRLARPARSIRLGDVAAIAEPDFQIAPCMPPAETCCPIFDPCVLRVALSKAADAFLAEPNKWTLADLVRKKRPLLDALGVGDHSPMSNRRINSPSTRKM
jgi:Rrf2 family nitric oxide-sensitive transcriptional repressor